MKSINKLYWHRTRWPRTVGHKPGPSRTGLRSSPRCQDSPCQLKHVLAARGRPAPCSQRGHVCRVLCPSRCLAPTVAEHSATPPRRLAQGSGGVTIPRGAQKTHGYGTSGHGTSGHSLAGMVGLGWRLDLVISEIFSNLYDPMIRQAEPTHSCLHRATQTSCWYKARDCSWIQAERGPYACKEAILTKDSSLSTTAPKPLLFVCKCHGKEKIWRTTRSLCV